MSERCAVGILAAPGGNAERTMASIRQAEKAGRGDFGALDFLPVAKAEGLDAIRAYAEEAEAGGADRLLLVSAAETLVPEIFVKTVPALRLHDAVWGAAGLVRPEGGVTEIERITRLAARDFSGFFHLALRWWIGPAHFVRPAHALTAATGVETHADYLLRLWRDTRVFKAAHPLTVFHGSLPTLSEADRERLLDVLDAEPVFTTVRHEGRPLRLPYTGRNPVIERDHTRGQFFEQAELDFLRDRLPRGMRIVDAGANTGNHTVFFAAAMDAASVIPIEPDPRASEAIRRAVATNDLRNVDLSLLGKAVGEGKSRMRAVFSEGGGLGATRLVPDPAGTIQVGPLDDLVQGKVDLLKIDVEGMEMAVLDGARGILGRDRPCLFIEVLDETIPDFLGWADSSSYLVERLFPDKRHTNYFAVPRDGRR